LSDIHDISPSDIDAPTNRDQFQDYFSRNQAIEYSIGKWLKNDELSIVESLANKIDVPILKDIIKKAIYDALIDRINWQVMRVTLMPNKRDDNLHVQFYLIMTLPNWSFDIPPKVTVDCKASFVYNLTYNDSTIIDDELDGNAWNFERIEDYN
jgi:hypothetical protein